MTEISVYVKNIPYRRRDHPNKNFPPPLPLTPALGKRKMELMDIINGLLGDHKMESDQLNLLIFSRYISCAVLIESSPLSNGVEI